MNECDLANTYNIFRKLTNLKGNIWAFTRGNAENKKKKYYKFIAKQILPYVCILHIFDAKYTHIVNTSFRYTIRDAFRPCQTSMTDLSVEVVKGFQPLTIFTKGSI